MEKRTLWVIIVLVILAIIIAIVFYQLTGQATLRVKYNIQGNELATKEDFSLNKWQELRIDSLLKNLDETIIKLEDIDEEEGSVVLGIKYNDVEQTVNLNEYIARKFDLNGDGSNDLSIELIEVASDQNAEFKINRL